MTNYTKTTDFAAKDALPSGNSAKIVKGSEIDTEFNNIATASATKANANSAALTGTTTFETISDGTIAITAFVDEDNMASDSATLLPTQQSVKAYVDSQVTAQDLDVTDGSTSIDIDLDSESLGILGGTGIYSTASGTGVTLAIDSTVATLTGSQTLSNKTLSTPVVSGNLTTDGLLDGRDVAADGTKLDGIEASADVTDTANVTAAGALMDSELTSEASVKALNQGVATTDSPTFAGLTTTADVSFGDNDKAIFGAGSDLQIYHDGTDSIINESTAGNLLVQGATIKLQTANGAKDYLVASPSAEVTLYHNNAAKLATNSTGIDVTGTATMDDAHVPSSGSYEVGGTASGTTAIGSLSNSAGKLTLDTDSTRSIHFKTGGNLRQFIDGSTGDISFYNSSGTSQSLFWDASAESLGLGTTSPAFASGAGLEIEKAGTATLRLQDTTNTANGEIRSGPSGIEFFSGAYGTSGGPFSFSVSGTTALTIDSSRNVGIGTTSPSTALHVVDTTGDMLTLEANSAASSPNIVFKNNDGEKARINSVDAGELYFGTGASGTERMRIDSSGNLLVGTTDAAVGVGNTNVGHSIGAAGYAAHSRSGNASLFLNRTGTDGTIASFSKDGAPVGSIGAAVGNAYFSGTARGWTFGGSNLYPANQVGAKQDNNTDLGHGSYRFDDIYATNGTIQTSDRNEKQDIEALSDAEQRVAVAAKGLLRKFRWINSVEENGDDARIHFGIIAQDLQDAFTAEGLDAGRYAMFISSTWTDEDGNEQTRLGVRYSELLAFIISAT